MEENPTRSPFFKGGRFGLRYDALIAITLAVLTAAVYAQVGNFDYVNYDDPFYVQENFIVQRGLTAYGVKWAFTTTTLGNWHPLTWLSYMIDCQLFGARPGAHHLVNVLFHLANAILLFFVLQRMTQARWRSAFVAALFALHPLHVESVAWIAERKDVLSTFFWMLTMGAYSLYAGRGGPVRYLLVFASLAAGLMAKSMLMTLPVILLLMDFWPLGRFEKTRPPSLEPAVPVSRAAPGGKSGEGRKRSGRRSYRPIPAGRSGASFPF